MRTMARALRRIAHMPAAPAWGGHALRANQEPSARLGRLADLGFDAVLCSGAAYGHALAQVPSSSTCLSDMVAMCKDAKLHVLCDIPAPLNNDDAIAAWQETLIAWQGRGLYGVRCLHPLQLGRRRWEGVLADVRRKMPGFAITVWTPGMGPAQWHALESPGFDACFSSLAWWDQRAPWLVEEYAWLDRIAPVIAPAMLMPGPQDPLDPRTLISDAILRQRLWTAAYTGRGLLMDAARALSLEDDVRAVNTYLEQDPYRSGRLEQLSGPLAAFSLLFWHGGAASALLLRHDSRREFDDGLALLSSRLPDGYVPSGMDIKDGADVAIISIMPAEKTCDSRPASEVLTTEKGEAALSDALHADRIAIENLSPCIDAGRFPVKTTLGVPFSVQADVFMDGHAPLAAELLWRPARERAWRRVPMRHIENDRWGACFVPQCLGRHEYTVEAWAHPDAPVHRTRHAPVFPLYVDRREAEFASWYELFPRSLGKDGRHGRLDDVIERLPAIRDMGFDVLYFPPIHPIGHTNRKGRNNSLTAQPGDPGSPYAIGSDAGGHTAIHPELGTLADFARLQAAVRAHDMELALDFAIQCSPDHPWLREHPEWFHWRPDGTVQYAENPPKRYEDIVNPDFYSQAATTEERMALWRRLRDVVLFWAAEGVRVFRVDNPHTKPLPFWEWMIREVQARHPDAIFLSEAFTRPKMMYRLAKLGFSQSYTYFTWRNEKEELRDYLREVSNPPQTLYFRPQFFVNTPDINPYFLQTSGRAGFLIRAALAATTSGLWGVYSGFELCEATPLPGREEYLDSEKYELRPRSWNPPGNIIAEITRLNRIRRAHPALQSHRGIAFHEADHSQVLFFSKTSPTADSIVLAAVNLDPHTVASVRLYLPDWLRAHAGKQGLRLRSLWTERESVVSDGGLHITLGPEQPFDLWSVLP